MAATSPRYANTAPPSPGSCTPVRSSRPAGGESTVIPISESTARRAAPAATLLLGVVLLWYSQVTTLTLGWRRLLVAVGIVYAVSGGSLWLLASRSTPGEPSFRSALAIAVVGTGIAVVLHLRHPHGLGWVDSPWSILFWEQLVLAEPHVTVPTMTALFLPLGFARSSRQRTAVLALMAVPFLIGSAVEIVAPGQFGPVFGFGVLVLHFWGGTFLGLVLYGTGHVLGVDDE